MTIIKKTALALIAGGYLSLFSAQAAEVFGQTYQPVAKVSENQVQIVFYRDSATTNSAAHIYIDGEFQSALIPGGYTTFCVAPGSHSVGAFVEDAPTYQGKKAQPWRSGLEGGKTYFLKVTNGQNGMPQAVKRKDAEVAMKSMRQQTHVLSRASSVQACNYMASPVQPKEYTLSGDVLFKFGKSDRNSITRQGREEINGLVNQIQREHTVVRSIQVIGHTDQIGSEAANAALGQRRASTVRQLMVEAGIPARNITASSAGMNEPLVNGCYGSKAEQISCYAPNRRVGVRVDGTANNAE